MPELFDADDEKYMQRCLQLADNGLGFVSPNPMVGAVVVHHGKIIGEGYHEKFGEAHAEVNALKNIPDDILTESTLYVNLEPCAHHGKTPPCADLIIAKKIKKVVVGCIDPFPSVSGKGIEKMRANGIEVITGICLHESRKLNKRFFTTIEKKRPYIILKYAQTTDGFMGIEIGSTQSKQISNEFAMRLSHRWRSEEDAILVGTTTAIMDNPQLNTRLYGNRNPVRVVLDKELKIPGNYFLLDDTQSTLIITSNKITSDKENTKFIYLDFQSSDFLPQLFSILIDNKIQSLIVEGGAFTLQSFIDGGWWDEAHIFTSKRLLGKGIRAPRLRDLGLPEDCNIGIEKIKIDTDELTLIEREQ